MRVLIALPEGPEATRLAQILDDLGHSVCHGSSPADALACIREARPDVAMVGTPMEPWLACLDEVPGPHIYRIALVTDEAAVGDAWSAGFDDVTRPSAPAEELAGRVAALDRIRGWLPSMGAGFGGKPSLIDMKSVAGLGETLAEEFGIMTGGPLSATRALVLPDLACSAEIPLSLSGEGKELNIGIGICSGADDAFGSLLFGEPVGREILADAMREFANTAGGALKRTAQEDGKLFSLGLPIDCVFPVPTPGAPIWRIQGEGIDIVVWTALVDDSPKRIVTGKLVEGMVLTQPVLGADGVLLVQAGSVLTQSTVRRLLELLGPNSLVEVARAA